MSHSSPRRPSIQIIDEREARRRDRFGNLALIAPTPEMIRQVLALDPDAAEPPESSGHAIVAIAPAWESSPAER